MAVYLKFEEGDNEQMSVNLLKYKDGELVEVTDGTEGTEGNDIECNVYEVYGLVLFQLISMQDSPLNKMVFESMQKVLDSFSDED